VKVVVAVVDIVAWRVSVHRRGIHLRNCQLTMDAYFALKTSPELANESSERPQIATV